MYDVLIVGGGPAGLTAAIYLSRAGRKTAVIDTIPAGGQAAIINEIANYPGFVSISGYELIDNMIKQAKEFGTEFIRREAVEINVSAMSVALSDGSRLEARAIVYAAGCKAKSLGLSGEKELAGSGVSYCATCDGGFYKGRAVAVAGYGKKAEEACEYLKNIASKVYLINRGGRSVEGTEKIDGSVTKLVGRPLTAVEVALDSGNVVSLETSCLFVEAGYVPVTHLLAGKVRMDDRGYIYTDENMMTDVNGIFAAGDVRVKNLRQIVTAAADGAIAAQAAGAYLSGKRE